MVCVSTLEQFAPKRKVLEVSLSAARQEPAAGQIGCFVRKVPASFQPVIRPKSMIYNQNEINFRKTPSPDIRHFHAPCSAARARLRIIDSHEDLETSVSFLISADRNRRWALFGIRPAARSKAPGLPLRIPAIAR